MDVRSAYETKEVIANSFFGHSERKISVNSNTSNSIVWRQTDVNLNTADRCLVCRHAKRYGRMSDECCLIK